MTRNPNFQIRARYTELTVRVYQAYPASIARPALAAGRFVAPFSFSRMTWIKPSFNWMMYRSGFATKPGQEVILAIDITREGFEWALAHAVLSAFHPDIHRSLEEWRRLLSERPVRIQWDPERDWRLTAMENVRTIQIGLSGEAVRRYVNDWIVNIEDVTSLAHSLQRLAPGEVAPTNRPDHLESFYPLKADVAQNLIPPR
jgi:uncharacterized protein DUF4291